MSDPLLINSFRKHFAKRSHFTTKEVTEFYYSHLPFNNSIPQATINWRIYRLNKMGVIKRIGQGVYKIGKGVIYFPITTKRTVNIYNNIKDNFINAGLCIWHTSTLNEFMLHQPNNFMLMVEVEKDAAESVFYFIKEKTRDVYFNPSKEIIQNYIIGKKETVIVKTLITDAPINEIYNVVTPSIEKILVDLFCDRALFASYQGQELSVIFKNTLTKYTINFSTLYRYAERRGRKIEITNFINTVINYND